MGARGRIENLGKQQWLMKNSSVQLRKKEAKLSFPPVPKVRLREFGGKRSLRMGEGREAERNGVEGKSEG